MSINNNQERVWIIQRCINAWKNHYENWPGYCENLMTYNEMMNALKECDERWLEYEFRGHNINFPSRQNDKGFIPGPGLQHSLEINSDN